MNVVRTKPVSVVKNPVVVSRLHFSLKQVHGLALSYQ